MAPAIELDGLRVRFGDVVALDGLDLTVERGEIFGFLGPNGAGKSTAINVLLDFVRPTAGSATVLGHDATDDPQAVRARTGVLPDGYDVYDRLTGRQHIAFAVDSKGADDDPDALLRRVGIADAADRPVGEYSKGMTQRLVLAMALAGEPDLLVLDEPSTGLDPNGARRMREIIREERDRGATVFFSSHVLGQVEAVCDRVGILRDGRLVAVDPIDDLRAAVGAGSSLTVELASSPPESAVSTVADADGVEEVTVRQNRLRVRSTGSNATVLEAVETAGLDVRDFSTEEASLEELFAAYTGGDDRPADAVTDPAGLNDGEEVSA